MTTDEKRSERGSGRNGTEEPPTVDDPAERAARLRRQAQDLGDVGELNGAKRCLVEAVGDLPRAARQLVDTALADWSAALAETAGEHDLAALRREVSEAPPRARTEAVTSVLRR